VYKFDYLSVCRDFLDVDMGRTKVVIGMLSPLLALEDSELEVFLTRHVHLCHLPVHTI